jgi:hypothetical protein
MSKQTNLEDKIQILSNQLNTLLDSNRILKDKIEILSRRITDLERGDIKSCRGSIRRPVR